MRLKAELNCSRLAFKRSELAEHGKMVNPAGGLDTRPGRRSLVMVGGARARTHAFAVKC